MIDKDEPHHCPPWCHECPDIEAIVRSQGGEPDKLDIMPWCINGGYGGLDACCCSHEDPGLDANTVDRALWFAAEKRRSIAAQAKVLAEDELRTRRRAKRSA